MPVAARLLAFLLLWGATFLVACTSYTTGGNPSGTSSVVAAKPPVNGQGIGGSGRVQTALTTARNILVENLKRMKTTAAPQMLCRGLGQSTAQEDLCRQVLLAHLDDAIRLHVDAPLDFVISDVPLDNGYLAATKIGNTGAVTFDGAQIVALLNQELANPQASGSVVLLLVVAELHETFHKISMSDLPILFPAGFITDDQSVGTYFAIAGGGRALLELMGNAVKQFATAQLTYADVVQSDAPLGYWTMGETTGTSARETTGRSPDGVYGGTVALGAAGPFSGSHAATFSQNGNVPSYLALTVPDLPTTTGAGVTVELWMNWDGTSAAMPFGFDSFDLFLYRDALGFNVNTADVFGFAGTTWLRNQWAHVVVEFQNGAVTDTGAIFINGQAQTISQIVGLTNTRRYASPQLHISGWAGQGNLPYSFSGAIAQVAVYGTRLDASRVAQHYAFGRAQR